VRHVKKKKKKNGSARAEGTIACPRCQNRHKGSEPFSRVVFPWGKKKRLPEHREACDGWQKRENQYSYEGIEVKKYGGRKKGGGGGGTQIGHTWPLHGRLKKLFFGMQYSGEKGHNIYLYLGGEFVFLDADETIPIVLFPGGAAFWKFENKPRGKKKTTHGPGPY